MDGEHPHADHGAGVIQALRKIEPELETPRRGRPTRLVDEEDHAAS